MMFDPYGRLAPDIHRRSRRLVVAVLWIAVIAIYAIYVPSHVSPLKLPGPAQLLESQQQVGRTLFDHTVASLLRVLLGFGIGSVSGIVVATFMYAWRPMHAALHGFLACLAPIPPIALTPFLILWFRLSYASQVGLIALGCFMVLVYSTLQALTQLSVDLKRATWSIGSRGIRHYTEVLLPAILPILESPLRIALAGAISLSTISEFMGAQEGLGVLVMVSRRTLETATILLAVIALGIMSFVLDTVLRTTLRLVTHWAR